MPELLLEGICYAREWVSDVSLMGMDSWRHEPAQVDGPTLVVFTSRAPNVPDDVVDALVARPDAHGLWIQSAPDRSARNHRQLPSDRTDIGSIPDPWIESHLDVLSEDWLDVPAWATPTDLSDALAWLCGPGRRSGNAFVEKPPAVERDQLVMLVDAAAASRGALQVGYNLNFAPPSFSRSLPRGRRCACLTARLSAAAGTARRAS